MRKAAQIALGLAISLLAFGLAFRGANLPAVGRALQEANYLYLAPAIGFMLLGFVARAQSWRVILGGQVPFRRAFDAMNEGYLLNNLLPFRLGELGRAYLVSRGTRLTTTQALSSVVVERVIDLLMVLVMLAALLPLVAGFALAHEIAAGSALFGVLALAALVVVARNRPRVLRLARAVLGRFKFLHPARVLKRVDEALDGLMVLRDVRRTFWAAFWSTGAWVTAALGAWMLLRAFLPDASPTTGFLILTVLGLGTAAPSAPGAAGVFEFFVVQSLLAFGVDHNLALSYAVVFHVLHFGMTTLLGGLALAREGETLTQLVQSAQAVLKRRQAAEEPLAPPAPNIVPEISPEK